MSETNNNCTAGVVLENGLANTREITISTAEEETTTTTITNITAASMIITHSTNTMDEPLQKEIMLESKVPEKQRICLVGSVVDDSQTVLAAKTFNVPIITSESGAEFVTDTTYTTYFILNEFEGPMFDAIRRSKHRIYGPPALQQVAESKDGLTYVNRPIYNFAMKGVITCFTGIRKKDELTRLVNLIHSMGGSIRKELNSKVTHLICNSSSGEKYQYAMTFGLTVIRASWVYEAWERRNNSTFQATEKLFTETHRLKAFEGQRICFFGFPADEHQHMIDILKLNGGIPTDLEDPECSHVIISNSADNFPEQVGATSPPILRLTPNVSQNNNAFATTIATINDKFLASDGLEKLNLNDNNSCKGTPQLKIGESIQTIVVTPKKSRKFNNENCDGIVLPGNEVNEFLEPANISPILHNIEEEEEIESNSNANGDDLNDKDELMSKRKRDSFDNISIISTDSFAPVFNSAKKPKLIRTGSITRSLRRSMSFVGLKNPITNMIRVRRNSIDPNASINSVTSMESTFSESIKRPVKEKIQSLKDRIMKNSNRSKREFCLTPKMTIKTKSGDNENDKFISPDEINTISCKKLSNSTMIDSSMATPVTVDSTVTNQSNRDKTLPKIMVKDSENVNEAVPDSDHADSVLVSSSKLLTTVDDQQQEKQHELKNSKTHIVKSEWFWYTIQKGYADEMDYLFGDYLESIAQTPGDDRRDSLPISLNNKRKRKRFSIRNAADSWLGASGKRRSSVSDAGLSVSGSFLDYTASPSCKHESKETSVDHTPKIKSMRYNHFIDLFGTESNYVGILHTIVSLFQKPLEDMADTSDALLNKSEVRAIFNNFSPIHEVHLQMLNHFREMQANWSENCLIGKIIIDHREALIKAYPPYVNFFEQMKEALQQCDAQNPRFHAFLKINQAKPECGRQTLQDLMIRPVQRLPSMSLLINDILKHTPKTSPDYKELEKALKAIKEVMTYINEDKRKTEGRLALFDIFNDIDHCPPDLVSSHRSFISKCEVTELSNCLSGRDDPLMIFLFTDYIEICKIRKSRGFNNMKSPTGTMNSLNTTTRTNTHNKSYKHIRLIPLSAIPCVYDINDSPRAFAITNKDKLYCFNISDDVDKIIYLKSFCKQLAENACRADAEQFLRSYDSHELGIDISDINFGTLKKVYNYARTRLKVSRAFSFKGTPLKLKRAISTTSPMYGSTNSLTPSAQMARMKLASCTNINEIGEDDEDDEHSSSTTSSSGTTNKNLLVAPMTVQPTRKAKGSTLSIAALRRL